MNSKRTPKAACRFCTRPSSMRSSQSRASSDRLMPEWLMPCRPRWIGTRHASPLKPEGGFSEDPPPSKAGCRWLLYFESFRRPTPAQVWSSRTQHLQLRDRDPAALGDQLHEPLLVAFREFARMPHRGPRASIVETDHILAVGYIVAIQVSPRRCAENRPALIVPVRTLCQGEERVEANAIRRHHRVPVDYRQGQQGRDRQESEKRQPVQETFPFPLASIGQQ